VSRGLAAANAFLNFDRRWPIDLTQTNSFKYYCIQLKKIWSPE